MMNEELLLKFAPQLAARLLQHAKDTPKCRAPAAAASRRPG